MVENTVVVLNEQLTDTMIEAGAVLTQKLDEMGVPISLAMWFFLPEGNEWRLFFAAPNVSTAGSMQMYEKVQKAQAALGESARRVPFSMIGVIDTNHKLARLLRTAVQTGPELTRIRFAREAFDGQFIDDALVYRSAA